LAYNDLLGGGVGIKHIAMLLVRSYPGVGFRRTLTYTIPQLRVTKTPVTPDGVSYTPLRLRAA